MPNNRQITDRTKVLSDSNRIVHVQYDVPPTAGHKNCFARFLQHFDLRDNIKSKSTTKFLRKNKENNTGLNSPGQSGNFVLGYTTENQVMASLECLPPSPRRTLTKCFGASVGNKHHLTTEHL